MAGFTELEVWKESRRFRLEIDRLCKKFPKSEDYLLSNQIKRSSRSITANIAEGHGRFHYKENIQFCRHARGSLEETKDHLIVAYDEKYITKEELKELNNIYVQCLKLLNGYIAYLKKKRDEDQST